MIDQSAAPPSKAIDSPVEVARVSVAAMKQGRWEAALSGFMHLRAHFGDKTPRVVFANAGTCLHRLGRYAEAEQMCRDGMGAQWSLIALRPSPPSEDVLLRNWNHDPGAPPTISILCVTYNHARYIDTAIRSFLSQQTVYPFEILVHDDASTDGTTEMVRAWQAKYPSIIRPVIQTENQLSKGVHAFDVLLKQARGAYVATCEGDDYWKQPTKLQKQVSFLEEHRDFSCSAHNYYLYNESALSVLPWLSTRRNLILSERQVMNVTCQLWLPTLVFRKTFSAVPEERAFAGVGDQFLTSYLGTFGKCVYFEGFLGAVRRVNAYSFWSPMTESKKDYLRVKTWLALVRMHERHGRHEVAADLWRTINASGLDEAQKAILTQQSLEFQARLTAGSPS